MKKNKEGVLDEQNSGLFRSIVNKSNSGEAFQINKQNKSAAYTEWLRTDKNIQENKEKERNWKKRKKDKETKRIGKKYRKRGGFRWVRERKLKLLERERKDKSGEVLKCSENIKLSILK